MRPIDADALIEKCGDWYVEEGTESGFIGTLKNLLSTMPTIQPEKAQLFQEGITSDMISKFIDGLEETFAYIREREGGDSVCGLCEYDGAYIGQSGDWCNECPGFDRDDCFKLSDKTRKKWTEEIIKALPTVQPEPQWIPVSERLPESGTYCLFTVFEHDSELEATTIETVYGRFDDYGERRYWSWEDEVGKCCIEGEEQLDGYHGEIIEKVIAWMPLPEPYQSEVERRTE